MHLRLFKSHNLINKDKGTRAKNNWEEQFMGECEDGEEQKCVYTQQFFRVNEKRKALDVFGMN